MKDRVHQEVAVRAVLNHFATGVQQMAAGAVLLIVLLGTLPPGVAAQGHAVRARGTFDLGPLALELQASRVEGLVFFLRPQHWAPSGGGVSGLVESPVPAGPEEASDADWHWARVEPQQTASWIVEARRLLREAVVQHAALRTKPGRVRALPPPSSGPGVTLNGVDGAAITIGVDTMPARGVQGADGYLVIRSGWNAPATVTRAQRRLLLELLDVVERGATYAHWQPPHERVELACAAPADGEQTLTPAVLVKMPTPAMNPQFPYRMQVFLEYAVDADGRVVPASIRELQADAPRWTEAVRTALLKAQYRPARVDGEPVASCVRRGWTFRSRFFP